MHDWPTLGALTAPVSADRFLDQIWEKQVHVGRLADRTAPQPDVLTMAEIDHVITAMPLTDGESAVVRADQDIQRSEYFYPSGVAETAAVYRLFAGGATIILNQLNQRLPRLASLCRALESELNCRTQTNIYLTPPEAQGFPAHYDSHDVFVLQVSGTKRWRIYDTPIELPLRGEGFDRETYELGPVTDEFTIGPGDIVYIPRGVVHDAVSTDQPSLHITLGLFTTLMIDVVLEAISAAAAKDVSLRGSLPPGFARSGLPSDDVIATVADAIKRAAAGAAPVDAVAHFAHDLRDTRHPLLPGQMAQVAALDSLDETSVVAPRDNLMTLIVNKDDQTVLSCYGRDISLPSYAEPTLRAMLNGEAGPIAGLPGEMDGPGKVTLARRLILEGVVQQVDVPTV